MSSGGEGLLTLIFMVRVSPRARFVSRANKLVENSYRKLKCIKCGFEADRDTVAILNIEKKAHEKMGDL